MLHPDQFDALTAIGQLKAIPKLQSLQWLCGDAIDQHATVSIAEEVMLTIARDLSIDDLARNSR